MSHYSTIIKGSHLLSGGPSGWPSSSSLGVNMVYLSVRRRNSTIIESTSSSIVRNRLECQKNFEFEWIYQFPNLIRCQNKLEGNRYLPLLRQLIIINIAGEYEGNVFTLEDYNVNNLLSFLSLIKCTSNENIYHNFTSL